MNDLLDEARSYEGELIESRRRIHKNPECGFELVNTRRIITDFLKKYGVESKICGRGSIVAEIGSGEECILLRADADALRINEESGLPFASDNGFMHACGHDIHTAMLLGAARILKEREGSLSHRVKLLFQASEENLSGAVDVLNSGCLKIEEISSAFMIHTVVGTKLSVGEVIIPPSGIIAPAADFFEIEIFGKASHGAEPTLGVDAIKIVGVILNFLYGINKVLRETVLTVGEVEGGTSPNVISDYARIKGTFRTMSDEGQQIARKYISYNVEKAAKELSGTAHFKILSSCPTFLNDEKVRKTVVKSVAEVLGEDRVHPTESSGGGSEDFAYFSRCIPSSMVAMAAGGEREGCSFPLHNSRTVFCEDVIVFGASVYAGVALAK